MRRRLPIAVVAVALAAGTLTPAAAGGDRHRPVHFPAHHTVKSGEWLWSIAEQFMQRVYDEFDYQHGPTDRAIDNEVAQIRKLNRDELDGHPDEIYPGERLLLANSSWDVPDGKAGWGTGFTYCTNESPPRHSRAPYPGMSSAVHLEDPPLTSGQRERARLVLTNHSDHARRFDVQRGRGLLVDNDGHAVAGVIYSDAIGVTTWTVKPHSRAFLTVSVRAKTCGDVRTLDRRVPPGHYRMYGVFHWATKHRSHDWASAPNRIRVVSR